MGFQAGVRWGDVNLGVGQAGATEKGRREGRGKERRERRIVTYAAAVRSGSAVGCTAAVVVRVDGPTAVVGDVCWGPRTAHAALVPGWGSRRRVAALPGGCCSVVSKNSLEILAFISLTSC